MTSGVHGIHHVTVISGNAQENVDFYVGVLGMRLVKKSVNQDAPDVYHLFYADGVGSPGTDLTFFPFPGARPGRIGVGMTVEVPFAVPTGSLSYWQERLIDHSVPVGAVETRFGEATLPFTDPHGLMLALVETDDPRQFVPWADSPVPPEHQLRGMHTVRLWERSLRATEALMTGRMGFTFVAEDDGWRRYAVDGGGSGKYVDIRELPQQRTGLSGAGTVHHVAFRVADTPEEMAVRGQVQDAGMQPTPQIDRFWFSSVYFREPGGVLFELATDGPGFDRDEDMAHLGERLILPPWLEQYRSQIESVLPPLTMPHVPRAG